MIGVLTAFLLASCKNQAMQEPEYSENEALTVLEADLKEFTLIRSEFAEDYVIRAAQTVMRKLVRTINKRCISGLFI